MSAVIEKDDIELPNNWITSPIGELGTAITGNTPPTKNVENYGGEIPFIKPTELVDKGVTSGRETISEIGAKNARILPKGGVLVSCIGYLGKTAIAKREVAFNQQINAVVFNEAVLPEYGFYYFQSPRFRKDLESLASGTTISIVNKSKFESISIPVAPPEQQKRIVAKIEELFSHIDAGIEALKKAKQLLKQYRQSVLKAAVTGELTKDLPCRQAGWRDSTFRNIYGKRVPETSSKYFAYVLECEDGSLYKGFSKDLFQRIDQHLAGQGAKWTKEHKPVSIVHFEVFDTEKEAVEREKYFKSGSGREWLNQVREEQNKKYEPASKLLERILKERRQKWEEQQLELFKAKDKIPKGDKWKEKYINGLSPTDSDLDEISSYVITPDWNLMTADQLSYFLTDGEHATPPRTDEGVPLLSARNIQNGWLSFKKIDHVSPETHEKLSKRLKVRHGDVLLSCSGTVGRSCVAPEGSKFSLVRSVAVLRPVLGNGEFMSYCFRSGMLQYQIDKKKTQTAQANIFQGKIKTLIFPLPSIEEQEKIVAIIKEKFENIERLGSEIDIQLLKSEKSKQSILAYAFQGKITNG